MSIFKCGRIIGDRCNEAHLPVIHSQGTLHLLEALRRSNLTSSAKFFNAGSRYASIFANRSDQGNISSFFPFSTALFTGNQLTRGRARYPKLRRCRFPPLHPHGCVTRSNVTRFAARHAVWCEQGCARDAWIAVLALLRTACCDWQVTTAFLLLLLILCQSAHAQLL